MDAIFVSTGVFDSDVLCWAPCAAGKCVGLVGAPNLLLVVFVAGMVLHAMNIAHAAPVFMLAAWGVEVEGVNG